MCTQIRLFDRTKQQKDISQSSKRKLQLVKSERLPCQLEDLVNHGYRPTNKRKTASISNPSIQT